MCKSTQKPGERPKAGPSERAIPTSESVFNTSGHLDLKNSDVSILGGVKKTLTSRARAKYVTNIIARPLAELRSPLQKAYKLSCTCAGELVEKPGKITAMYCRARWCVVCSRIRTGHLINGYMPAIEAMKEKWFLTLSRPNVPGAQLVAEIKHYLHTASLIQRKLRTRTTMQYSSLRKIECTYNEERNDFHPHFHFIFDSWEAANATLQEWMARNPTAQLTANKLIEANNGSVKELFKYFTKVASKSKSKSGISYRIHLEALDTMFVAMQRVRTFQPCGVIKAVDEEIEITQVLESGREQVSQWSWGDHDWINTETREALTGYQPEAKVERIKSTLVYPAQSELSGYLDLETGEVLDLKHAPQLRNSMRYRKFWPAPDEQSAPTTRRKFSSSVLISADWESQRQEMELPAPTQPLVPAKGPEMAPAPLLFAQLDAAPGGAGAGGLLDAHRAAPVGDLPTPGQKLLPVIKSAERKSRARPAQGPVSAPNFNYSIF